MRIVDRIANEVPFLACDGITVPHGFSTRLGGVSEGIWESMNLGSTRGDEPEHVRENYRRFCAAIGADVTKIAMSNQIHGDVVRTVTLADVKKDLYDSEGYEVDGLVTDIPGVALTIFNADCLPILFHDPVRKVVAAAHAGWRGTALGIAERAVEKMCQYYGSYPGDIVAAIGPGISRCCFETHAEVPEAMLAALGDEALPYIDELGDGKFKVDLKGLNALRLTRAGVLREHLAAAGDCTMCRTDKYWSHRATQGKRGSMAAMICL
ncbi:MAG: peptidoglycan editing factor PgeF [Clostridia bacterium]|nr:peptidoglycan editing factor PgeF [Clostridia bacterium]